MATTRRDFITGVLAAASVPRLSWADAGGPSFLAAARDADGMYALFGLSAAGADVFRVPLPDRGHAAAAHPNAPEAVIFARRPGRFALVLDCVSGRVLHRLLAPEGRHFYGHGTFVGDGALLCTTENDIATGQGRIGLWSRDDGYARVGEISSGGIGPHEVVRLPGDVLAIANGGIRTDPAQEGAKLNLDTMRPNLAYATLEGGVEERLELDSALHRNSIRHLAAADGIVAFAMQWQGDPMETVPLLGLHRRGGHVTLCTAELAEQRAMQGYAGSVAMSQAHVAITSPRGGRLHVFWRDGSFATTAVRPDVCGLAAGPFGLVATDGLGGVTGLRDGTMVPLRSAPDRAWDNHIVPLWDSLPYDAASGTASGAPA